MAEDLPYHLKVARDVRKGFKAGIVGGLVLAAGSVATHLSAITAGSSFALADLGVMAAFGGSILTGCALGAAAGLVIGAIAHCSLFERASHQTVVMPEKSARPSPAAVANLEADASVATSRHRDQLAAARAREMVSERV